MWLLSCIAGIALLAAQAQALYFYIDGQRQKCFFEVLPKDTLVVGNYKAQLWNHDRQGYIDDNEMGIVVTIDETFDNDHRVVNVRGSSSGKFTFTAADNGEHRLCFAPTNAPHHSGWSILGHQTGGIKLELDLAIGDTSKIERSDKTKLSEVAEKVRGLNAKLADVRREQVFQREREAEFRDQSESVNARVVKWTLVQIVLLAATCTWQLRYLRAFFIKQKLG
ncbi:COPII vesicle coat component Erp5/Erp6 [Teratosphaeria nubilosa]|uniref:COPII vesicle coat component Erp5/Erp6 n=1 Tax=Teratosphaeria nubilosa TaxID=161662 RepID=A0A6G1LGT0_9PEZI|nr:COPII vesicle coat component Erp5/Erp6 [Teratosphaeria nubilosa]